MTRVLRDILPSILILGCAIVLAPQASWAQAKTAKACTEEWRADKANFQAKGITEKAYVAQCRGTATTAAPAPSPVPPPPPPPASAQPTTSTGQKTAKACTDEWRADKANFQSRGITERAYVAQCRAGAAPPAGPVATAPAPTINPIAPPQPPLAPSDAGSGKTAKACIEEWRADKANFQARGITQKAYVAQCRTGATVAAPAAPPPAAPAPSAPPPAPTASNPADTQVAPARPLPRQARPVQPAPETGSPQGSRQFATEMQAMAACPGDTVVWVNLVSKIYHFAGTHNYGNTKSGAYMCEADTAAQGMRAAKNEQHP